MNEISNINLNLSSITDSTRLGLINKDNKGNDITQTQFMHSFDYTDNLVNLNVNVELNNQLNSDFHQPSPKPENGQTILFNGESNSEIDDKLNKLDSVSSNNENQNLSPKEFKSSIHSISKSFISLKKSLHNQTNKISNNISKLNYSIAYDILGEGIIATNGSLEKSLLSKYEIIKNDTSFHVQINNKVNLKKMFDDDKIIKLKIQDEFIESSVIHTEGNPKYSKIENDFFENSILNKKQFDEKLFYPEQILQILLSKYKPQVKEQLGTKAPALEVNTISSKSLIHNENYLKYNFYIKELNNKVQEVLSRNRINSNSNTQSKQKVEESISVGNISLQELHFINQQNTLIKIIMFSIHSHPFNDSLFIKWKINLLNLHAKWKHNDDNLSVRKLKIGYLKAKLILGKIIVNKQKNTIGKCFVYNDEILKNKTISGLNIMHLYYIFCLRHSKKLPRFTFHNDSTFMIFYDFMVDLSILYFFLITPVRIVLKVDYLALNVISMFFDAIYFFNMIRKFRRLTYTDTKIVEVDLYKLFINIILDISFIVDIISYIPYISFFSNLEYLSNNYYLFLGFPVLRILNFGKSLDFMEKSKYAMLFRLVILNLRYIIYAHWFGLLFINYMTSFDYFSQDYIIEDECKILISGGYKITNDCFYVIALMNGEYLIPGSYFSGLKNIGVFTSIGENFFLFACYFIGQIIVAYVFGGVNDLIKNLNQAANIYREKVDTIKSFMLFYNFNKEYSDDITTYYEYMWKKKRSNIYDKNLLYSLSEILKVKINEIIFPHSRFFLNDFYGLSKTKEKKLISSLISGMKEYIAYPYERVYTQGNLIKGLFILTDGTATFVDGSAQQIDEESQLNDSKLDKVRHDLNHTVRINRKELVDKLQFNLKHNVKEDYKNNIDDIENNSACFPLDAIFMKTGRAIETCYVEDFTDFYVICLDTFDKKLLQNFPDEMNHLQKKAKKQGLIKIGDNERIKELVFRHSARSINSFYEEEYNLKNIWIEINKKINLLSENKTNNNKFLEQKHSSGTLEFNFLMIRKLNSILYN